METLKLIAIFVIGIIFGFIIIGGLWYVVLWSFNFPISFAWKQVIGIVILTGLFGSYACMKN